jgi:hypothetical protein
VSARGTPGHWLAIAASVVVVATVVAAVVAMGPPSQQREARLDARRVQDLQRIVQAVDGYYANHKALPADMATLATQPGWGLATADPQSGTPYSYEVSGERTYRVCASFTTDTAKPADGPWAPDSWNHGIGRQCFQQSVSKAAP